MSGIIKYKVIGSHSDLFKISDILKIKYNSIIGEGGYGIVLGTDLKIAIKLYKNSLFPTCFENNNKLLPSSTENREILFLSNILSNLPDNYPKNLILPLAIGYITDPVNIRGYDYTENSYIMLMNEYKPFFTIHKNLKSINFLNTDKTRKHVYKLIVILLKISRYLEKYHNLINLDFKINNIMYNNNNNIVVIDLGLIKKIKKIKTIFISSKKYYIWPDTPCYIYSVPLYSIAINALELLFGHSKFIILKKNEYLNKLKIIDRPLYNIIDNMLLLKFNSAYILSLIYQEYVINKLKNTDTTTNIWFKKILSTLSHNK